jgi:hypothetical protein
MRKHPLPGKAARVPMRETIEEEIGQDEFDLLGEFLIPDATAED